MRADHRDKLDSQAALDRLFCPTLRFGRVAGSSASKRAARSRASSNASWPRSPARMIGMNFTPMFSPKRSRWPTTDRRDPQDPRVRMPRLHRKKTRYRISRRRDGVAMATCCRILLRSQGVPFTGLVRLRSQAAPSIGRVLLRSQGVPFAGLVRLRSQAAPFIGRVLLRSQGVPSCSP